MNCVVPLAVIALTLQAAQPITFDLPSTAGARRNSSAISQHRATVLLFLATDCPISNRYSPLIHLLETKYTASGVQFFAVFSAPDATQEAIRRHLTDFRIDMEGLLDPTAQLARQTGARVTPEAVVLSAAGAVAYRGRIDNRYVSWGQTRLEATESDLQEALDEVLAGKPVTHPYTKALGCSIQGF